VLRRGQRWWFRLILRFDWSALWLRIFVDARSAASELTKSKRKGHIAEHDYLNSDGNTVFLEFVGVMELLALGTECDSGEVWYDIRIRVLPMSTSRRAHTGRRRIERDL